MKSDRELLCQYAEAGCEVAFAELVNRYVNLVYSAALRQVNGDAHLAQDVSQAVFSDLARKAGTLLQRESLAGWLYTSTHFASSKAVRAEHRRHVHEQKAMQEMIQNTEPEIDWQKLQPVLDTAMHQLSESERELILMRYFENRRLAEIGENVGLTEDAARKRIDRALDKLRTVLFGCGVTTSAALGSTISSHGIQAAPFGCAAILSKCAVAGSSTVATTATITKAVAMTTIQRTIVGGLFALVVGTAIHGTHQASLLRQQVNGLQQERASLVQQLENAKADTGNRSNQLAGKDPFPAGTERLRELLRLRGQIGVLRRQQHELQEALASAQSTQPTQLKPSPPQLEATPSFQVQLVSGASDANTLEMTNRSSGANGEVIQVNKTPLLDYTAVRSATVTKSSGSGEPEINIELNEEGRDLFAAITKENLNKRLAIVMNGQVYAAPTIRSEIGDGKAQITGHFTEQEANQLVAQINESIRYQ